MAQKIMTTCVPVSFLVMGPIDNNVYIVDDGEARFVVDPTCDPERILEELGGRTLDAIVITHGHGDHMGAACALREATGAQVIASKVDAPYIEGVKPYEPFLPKAEPCPVDRMVEEGDTIELGTMEWRVIATPGHTPGGICLFLDSPDASKGAPVLISGDTLFAGTHGRVDFEGGDLYDMRDSLIKLAALPPETVVLPGHNSLTTIAKESGWLKLCCM